MDTCAVVDICDSWDAGRSGVASKSVSGVCKGFYSTASEILQGGRSGVRRIRSQFDSCHHRFAALHLCVTAIESIEPSCCLVFSRSYKLLRKQ